MDEYRLSGLPTVLPRGRVVFRFHNVGNRLHGPLLIPLPDDMPPIDVQLRGPDRRSLFPLAGIAPSVPGSRRAIAVDLRPGRYAVLCPITADDGKPHSVKGMATEFRVR